jgi:glycosyltransferase involved in cell wall biosynthesis
MTVREERSPRVTVGLPFRDCASTLLEAIQSVFAQTCADWELVLVDDGSGDASPRIAASVNDPRVRVVSDGVHRGLVYRLNLIADLARAPYLCRMDGDDLMHPRRLEAQLAYLEAHPDVDVAGSGAFALDDAGQIRGVRKAAGAEIADPAAVLWKSRLLHPTIMGRTAWFRANRYAPRFVRAEDHELWCRTVAHSRFAVLDEPLLFYREPARVNVRNYVLSSRSGREIYRRYGPELVGRTGTAAHIARSLAKEACYLLASRVGLAGVLVSRRSRALAPEERARADATLERVRGTPVPGLAPG